MSPESVMFFVGGGGGGGSEYKLVYGDVPLDRVAKLTFHYIMMGLIFFTKYCIHGYFHGGFIFANFASQPSQKFP